ncbi:hypothetical protein [Candidatus Nephthysia bennettiae]|uniref:Polymerase nucleotidyl transferase domain-containing protein n=1 Tax=Candidatus Nephthysia bennettiae TaxID=3127016 RepID=A0A934JVN4_9BACT|nr:hypothetical protein [Candidatus Dormibacteraeota bacterium]MBJ7612760.1 hypothetical protein [Candidatus Dormibacteraeota bacterium]
MLVGDAREIARRWVMEGGGVGDLCGAYLAGSTSWLPASAVLSGASDVDVMVVIPDGRRLDKRGKLVYRDVLLDVSPVPGDHLCSADRVLGDYHLAGGFRTPSSIILDPSGQLTALQAAVSGDYARRRWVQKRCEHARRRVLEHLGSVKETAPIHDQVTAWLFGAGVTTHVLLVAGLRNPTVRGRYAAVRELLADCGRLEFHETLLELLGCASMSRDRVEQHLATLSDTFDAAASVSRTPLPFTSDITAAARPIAIDGSRDFIERGLHREAVFWIAVTYSRCQKILDHDAPADMKERFDPGYRQLLGDLGVTSSADIRQRREEVERLLPRLWEEAEAIMAANRAIED